MRKSFLREAYMNVKPMKEVEEYLAPVAQSVGAELLEAVWNNRDFRHDC